MRLYITAPMTNCVGYNFHAFDAAAVALDFLGHDPISPADHDREIMPDIEASAGFATGAPISGALRTDLLAWDLRQVIDCDGIVILPGKGGRGSYYEREVARALDKRVFHLVTEGGGIGLPWVEGAELRLIEIPKTVVIGLSGYAQTGKSTAALSLSALGFVDISTADAIREAAYQLNPRIKVKGNWTALQTHVARVGWEKAKELPGVREILQRLGTEVGDIIDEAAWANVVRRRIESAYDGFDTQPEPARYVVSSVRRHVDARNVVNMGGEVWRIEREGFGPANNHSSETALDAWPFDAVIHNDGRDLTNFTNVVAQTATLRGVLDPGITEKLLAFFADSALADTPA